MYGARRAAQAGEVKRKDCEALVGQRLGQSSLDSQVDTAGEAVGEQGRGERGSTGPF